MDDVQLKLSHKRISKCTSVSSRRLNTDKNFAVLKCQHISCPRLAEKLLMQARDPAIGNQPDENIGQST